MVFRERCLENVGGAQDGRQGDGVAYAGRFGSALPENAPLDERVSACDGAGGAGGNVECERLGPCIATPVSSISPDDFGFDSGCRAE